MRGRKLTAAALGAAIVVLIAIFAVGYPVYVTPVVDQPRAADAVVVLGGSSDDREQVGIDLADEGYAPRLILSNPYGPRSPLTEMCADTSNTFSIDCFVPDPNTTRGEAREIRDRAEREHWSTIIVVTSKAHLSRARYIFGKCWSGNTIFIPSRSDVSMLGWLWSYTYQTAGYVRASVENC